MHAISPAEAQVFYTAINTYKENAAMSRSPFPQFLSCLEAVEDIRSSGQALTAHTVTIFRGYLMQALDDAQNNAQNNIVETLSILRDAIAMLAPTLPFAAASSFSPPGPAVGNGL